MERLRRVDVPTTLVLRDEIRRVPKRAALFTRALAGDLGEKARHGRTRFAVKHPLVSAMTPLIRGLVPLQGTRAPLQPTDWGGDLSDGPGFRDHAGRLRRRLDPGRAVDARLLARRHHGRRDGGVMAAYVRRVCGVCAAHGLPGLGELSRIGALILNPIIGLRSKSVLFTTDLPLAVDKPIDFGLQAVCNMCMKCARECPCNAIPFGPKVMFNGCEIWKPDVEKCGKYRLTNMKGSACCRCMKTCPSNREDLVDAERLLWLSIDVPAARRQLIDHDDGSGGGQRNLVKRWWFDLVIVNGVAQRPQAGVNERDLDLLRTGKLAATQKLALFPPELQPAGGTTLQTGCPSTARPAWQPMRRQSYQPQRAGDAPLT